MKKTYYVMDYQSLESTYKELKQCRWWFTRSLERRLESTYKELKPPKLPSWQ